MRIPSFLFLFLVLNLKYLSAQKCTLKFEPAFGNEQLALDHKYTTKNGDTIDISTLKFYISDIALLQHGVEVFNETDMHHLIDAENESTMNISLPCEPGLLFNQIRFNVGIDSITNHGGALGGDLDPTLGMYWTWQNGYINLKLEGKSPSSSARNHEFQYHIGGYSAPFNALQTVNLDVGNNHEIIITVAVDQLFDHLDISALDHIMSPGTDGIHFSKQIAAIFFVKKK